MACSDVFGGKIGTGTKQKEKIINSDSNLIPKYRTSILSIKFINTKYITSTLNNKYQVPSKVYRHQLSSAKC